MYHYQAEIVRVVDGDTIVLRIDLGFRMTTEQSFRLYGLDTPELRSTDADERARAKQAKDRLSELCPVGEVVSVRTHKADKYGRWLVEILGADGTVNDQLIVEGHARPYQGGARVKGGMSELTG